MTIPTPWLERVPTYKEQIEQLAEKDLSTLGFLGYPLLQTADISSGVSTSSTARSSSNRSRG
jgi:tryptophanyl-tRNA synthetase